MPSFVWLVMTCGKTTYRKEIGVGYVFMYDTINNTSYPVAGAKIIVSNKYSESGLFGKKIYVAEESYTTDAEGYYQVRFIERGCYTYPDGKKEMVYCNTYYFFPPFESSLGVSDVSIDIRDKDNIFNFGYNKIRFKTP